VTNLIHVNKANLVHNFSKYVYFFSLHTKKNCAPSWFYLQDYTGMHGQQNI